jgi:hypothetical protein
MVIPYDGTCILLARGMGSRTRALWNLNHIIDSKCRIKPEDKGLMESQGCTQQGVLPNKGCVLPSLHTLAFAIYMKKVS